MKTKNDIEYRKVLLDKAAKLYNMPLEIYTDKFNMFLNNIIAIKGRPRILRLKGLFSEDDMLLLPEIDKEEINDIPST